MPDKRIFACVVFTLFLFLSPRGFGADTQNAAPPAAPTKALPLPGEVFEVQGRTAFLIRPPGHTWKRTPWVWYAPTLPGLPGKEERWMFEQFTNAGIAIAGIDVGESYGSPTGRTLYTALYDELVKKRHMSKKPCMLPRSRGGLMVYNWAVEHPKSVSGIAGIYPVCDLRTYPGIDKASRAYEMTKRELADHLAENNPVDRVESLAEAHVPIFHIHGDSDHLVPLDKNSAALALQYRKFGGSIEVKVIPGQGHSMWPGYFHCQELVDFVIARATGKKMK